MVASFFSVLRNISVLEAHTLVYAASKKQGYSVLGGNNFNLRVYTKRLEGNGKKVARILKDAFQATEAELRACEQWLINKLPADSKCADFEIKKLAELAHFDLLKRIRPLTAHWMGILGLSTPLLPAKQFEADRKLACSNAAQWKKGELKKIQKRRQTESSSKETPRKKQKQQLSSSSSSSSSSSE